MTTVEILRAARKLIEKPGSWTQGSFARDINAEPAGGSDSNGDPLSDEAICWCASGAILRASEFSFIPFYSWHTIPQFQLLAEAAGTDADDIADWNDETYRDHTEVVAAFDRAIALAEEDERT